ncbi:MAG: alpha/beta hydrolase [Methylocystaceae bacterium]
MTSQRRGLILVIILVLAVLLYFNLTRQFIKMTALFALPVVMLYLLRARLPGRNIGRSIIAAAMVLIIVIYGIQLVKLPVKAKVWDLNEQGAALVAAGKYDQARQVYVQMGELGDEETMQRKLAQLQVQEGYAANIKKARELAKNGNKVAAIALLKSVPPTAGSYREARKLLKTLD